MSAIPRRIPGESMVWVTGLGLALSLTMAGALLLVILANGIELFWPKRINQITVTKDNVTEILLGEEVERRIRHDPDPRNPEVEEVKFYLGNKDAGNATFRFVDSQHITATSQPAGVVKIERQEYGYAIGVPVALKVRPPEGKVEIIPAEDPRFSSTLQHLLEETSTRWAAIRRLEKGPIGDNAAAILALENRMKRTTDAAERKSMEAEVLALKQAYKVLSDQVGTLRAAQKRHKLTLRLADGKNRDLNVEKILHVTYPNQMGTLDRILFSIGRVGQFLWENPREVNTEGGIFPAIFGTFVMTIMMSLCVVPFGVLAAVYLREYAVQGPFVRGVRIAVNNLAGVPSIVFGVFGLGFFVYFVGGNVDRWLFSDSLPTPTFGTGGILWSAATLALMTVPVVIVATEESIASIPRGIKEASLACGASKWQTVQSIILPAAVPGILTGTILAMARGSGEVAPLMLVGVVKLAPSLPLDLTAPFVHLDQKFMHLGFHIYDLGFQSPDSEAARPMVFATTLFLILLVLGMNLGAILLREKLRRKFATSAF